jgi:hypothetical protein
VAPHVRAWVLWWVALFWLWLLLVGEWNRIEWIAAAVAATVGASIAEAARAASGLTFRISLRDVASAWTVPAMIFVDFVIVIGALVLSARRREIVRGRFVVRRFEAPLRPAARRFGATAWRTYAANISPNAFVVDVDLEEHTVLLHDLVVFRKSEEPAA